MKKQILFILLVSSMASSLYCQTDPAIIEEKVTNDKNKWYCLAEITFINKDAERYVLSHFSNDSIFVYPLIGTKNKKEMQMDQMLGFKAASIKKIFFRIDKKISIADSFFTRMSLPAGDSATLSNRMLNRNALQSHQALSLTIETITSSPEADVLMLPVLPIFLLADIAFLIGSKGKEYPINGKEKKFYRMVDRLTGKYQNDTTELYPTF